MRYLVQCLQDLAGNEPDGEFADGIIIESRRENAHDLVVEANRRWKTSLNPGEVYQITALATPCRTVKVQHDYAVREVTDA